MNILSKTKQFLSKNILIKGTFILTFTGIITRIIGFYNRIFLTNLIGAKELGIYQLILPIYMLAFALSVSGNESALTKLVSETSSKNDYQKCKMYWKVSFVYCLLKSLCISALIFMNSKWICMNILNSPECEKCLRIISFGIPFMSMKGTIHGFFLGLSNCKVHGISDFVEQCTKLLSVYILSIILTSPFTHDAGLAVCGIVIGEIIAFLYSLQKIKSQTIPNTHNNSKLSYKTVFMEFVKETIPFTSNRFTLTLFQSIEAVMIPTVLLSFYNNSTLSLSEYGIFSGVAFPFIMFPATITNSLSTMLLPAISSANSLNNQKKLSYFLEYSVRFCMIIGLFSAVLFYVFGKEIGYALFHNTACGTYLYNLSFLCPFIYLSTALASVLNGLGKATVNLIQTLITTFFRIGCILILVPKIGLSGYIYGLLFSYIFLSLASNYQISKTTNYELRFVKSMFLPFIYFTITATLLFFLYKKSTIMLPSNNIIMLFLILFIWGIVALCPFAITIYKEMQQLH